MRFARILIIVILTVKCGSALALQWINPIVQVHMDALSKQDADRLAGLSGQIADYLRSYRPSGSEVSLIPIVPVTCTVDLSVVGSNGTEQLIDLRIAAYRPIFDQDTESLILLASEVGVPFTYVSSRVFVSNDLGALSDPLYLRLHYYATVALALYYDSMDTYGGDAFWESLRIFQSQYETAWQASGTPDLPPLHPRSLLSEVGTQWGDHFRDLWFMYHLEMLDRTGDPRRNTNLTYILEQLVQLYVENRLYTLFQLLRDAKSSEVISLYRSMPAPDRSKSRPFIRILFSSDTPDLL